MIYRQPAEEQQHARPVVPSGPLVRLDASGRDGQNGADGAVGHSGSRKGADGERGGDADAPSRGEDGGSIVLHLESGHDRDPIARLRATIATSRGGKSEDEHALDFARAGDIELIASGGDGGDGGDGGRGGDGATGRTGADATRFSSGENGGRGGDGGDGGKGTSGARGGAGGNVVVRVRDTDTHLLMLLAHDVQGGAGGRAGANGAGGKGGSGGEGGSSYRWTETESYTDSNGQRQTRSTSHSNRGGSRGSSGRDGRAARAVLEDGENGKSGASSIEVLAANARVVRYPSRYDVRLVSFSHRNANDDGIYEPEEKVFVSRVEVENVGGMPTPAHHDITVGLVDDGWIAPAEGRLTLPRSLAPGARHVFTHEELALSLRVFRPQKSDDALAAAETLRFFAELPDARRRFAHFETEASVDLGRLVVRFPIEASPLTSLFSLAPGQAARIRWSITNVSDKALGREAPGGRGVSVFLGLARDSRLGASAVHFIADTGARVPLDLGFRREIPKIDAKQTISFEGTIAIDESTETYTTARLFLAAELGHIEDPENVRPIQYQEVIVTVGRSFDARDADVLFIVNNRTTGAELAAWEDLARSLGLTFAVWDAALEGGVAVLGAIARGELSYRLAVVLDNTMDTANGERRASVLIDKLTGLALARVGTHVLYVGRFPDLDDLVVPTDEATSSTSALAHAERDAILAACDAEEVDGNGVFIDARTRYLWPWLVPKQEDLVAQARALAEDLEKRWPDRRYLVTPRWAPAEERKIAWVRDYRLGRLVVRRTLDPARTAVSGLIADASAMHDAAFVHQPATIAAVSAAMPFQTKLELLSKSDLPYGTKRRSLSDPACDDALAAAVLADLVREQALVSRFKWGTSRKALTRATPMLSALARDAFPEPVELGSHSGRRCVELLAWLELVARSRVRFWEWLLPFLWLRRAPALRSLVRESIDAVIERAAGSSSATKALRAAIEVRYRELRDAWRARKRKYDAPPDAGGFVLERIDAHLEGQRVETDGHHLPPGARVLSGELIDQLRDKDRGRLARSGEVVSGAAKARADLLRKESCSELLAIATAGARATSNAELASPTRVAEAAPPADSRGLGDLSDLREDLVVGDRLLRTRAPR